MMEEDKDGGLLGTPDPAVEEERLDAPWEPSGVAVGVPTADIGRPVRERPPRPERARDPGYALRGAGWSVLVFGAVLYLFAVWSTAERVHRGVPDAAVRLGGSGVLLGTVALASVVVGLLVLAVGYLVPPRRPIPTVPGNADYETYVDDVAARVRVNNGARWAGLILFVVGLLVALHPLRQAAGGGAFTTFDAAGATLHTHSVGVALAAVGALLFLILGARQRALDELLLQTRSHRTLHARRGPIDGPSWPEGEEPQGPIGGTEPVPERDAP